MKAIKILSIIAAIVVLLVAVKFLFLQPTVKDKAGKGPSSAPTVVNIFVTSAETISQDVYTTGSIIANEEVHLVPEVSGRVVKLNFTEGRPVTKGQLLVKINDADYQAQLTKLQLQAAISAEKIARLKKMLEVSGVSKEEFDVAVNLLKIIESDIEFTKAQIAKTEIRAPFNGTIGLKSISVGGYVSPSTIIASIQQLDVVKVDFSVPAKYSDLLKQNTEISFTSSNSTKVLRATVYAVEPTVDQSTRTIQLRARARNNGSLYPGAFVNVVLPLKEVRNAILIPTQAIIPILKGKKVFLFKNGKAIEQVIETGVRTDARIMVTSGVAPGDSIITTGFVQLKNNSPVKVLR